MNFTKKAGKRFPALLLALILLVTLVFGIDTPALAGRITPSVGSRNNKGVEIERLSTDINNPSNMNITLDKDELRYTVDMRPSISNTTKYLYTDPSYDDAFLIASGNCRTSSTIDVIWEHTNPSLYPVELELGERVVVWAKYVENYGFNPSTYYYTITLVAPASTSEVVYMSSLAGQRTHPPLSGEGSLGNPYTGIIYLPLSKESIENPNPMGVIGDVRMTGSGYSVLYTDETCEEATGEFPLEIGENQIYLSIYSPASNLNSYYNIKVYRGNPFQKTSLSPIYAPGGELDYSISWVLPEAMISISEMLIVDNYDPSEISFDSITAFTVNLIGGRVDLDPDVDFDVDNDEDTGELSITLNPSGLAKMQDEAPVELILRFHALPPEEGEDAAELISNIAALYYDDTLFGQSQGAAEISDYALTASLEEYTMSTSGQSVVFTNSFTLPDDLSTTSQITISNNYPEDLVYTGVGSIKIGEDDAEDIEAVQNEDGSLQVVLLSSALTAGDTVEMTYAFDISESATRALTGTGSLYHVARPSPAAPDGTLTLVKSDSASLAPLDGGGPPPPPPGQAIVRLRARKTITGEGASMSAGQFSFTVYDGGYQIATATNDAAGNIAFPVLEFSQQGTYYYIIKETMSDGSYYGWYADESEHDVEIIVTQGASGLVARVNYLNDEDPDENSYPEFINRYYGGTATLQVSKVLYDDFGGLSEIEGIFWVELYVRDDEDNWVRVGRYPIPANEGHTTIPDLPSGRTYQLVEEESIDGSFSIIGQTVSVGSSVLGSSSERYVTFTVPPLSLDTEIDIVIRNQGIPGESESDGPVEDEEEEELLILEEEDVPLTLFTSDHSAYIMGYPDGTVRPEQNVTRAEVATVFYRLLSNEARLENWATANNFSDVVSSNWHNEAVSVMSKMGIVNGYPNGTFRPSGSITRAELATIAARFARGTWEMPLGEMLFSDIEEHWASHDIQYAAAIGWVNGYPDGTYRPNQPITRAEFMTLVNRMMERIPESIDDLLHDTMITWTDNANTSAWYYIAVQEATNSHSYEYKDTYVSGTNTKYEKWVEILN
ncbi:MAG: S-layer homology domain-containing protein [Oscillospiraceae bacterium]|nr:S-layer homology domain-containing protein [Oscillospiraceae bacterium]